MNLLLYIFENAEMIQSQSVWNEKEYFERICKPPIDGKLCINSTLPRTEVNWYQ